MKLPALALVAAAGCATTPDPYSVDAAAQLAPVATPAGAEAGITGPIEILGFALPFPDGDYSRTFAAYKVDLPEGAAPWVRIYTAASCDAPPDQAAVFADLGAIRRVGDETHFFARGVEVGDRKVDIDIGTVASLATLDPSMSYDYMIGKLAVVQAPGEDTGGGSGGGSGDGSGSVPGIPAGGPWLACGVFELN